MPAPVLLLGLGNTLAGDDGVGALIAAALAADPRLPARVEAVVAGPDLLRCCRRLEGREHIVLVDALLDPAHAGVVQCHADTGEMDAAQGHAHHLSAVQSLELLRRVLPGLAATRFTWITVGVADVRISRDLSPALAAALPGVVDRVLGHVIALPHATS
jgi:hydrogenase maturation protease